MKTKYLIRKILRKIYHFIGFISLFIFLIVPVYADDTFHNIDVPVIDKSLGFCGNGGCSLSLDTAYNQLISLYNNNYANNYNTYFITYLDYNGSIRLTLNLFNSSQLTYSFSSSSIDILANYNGTRTFVSYDDNTLNFKEYNGSGYNSSIIHNGDYSYFDSNFDLSIQNYNYTFTGIFSSSDIGSFPISSILPKLKDLYNYNSWNDYNNGNTFSTVNLDNYDYVLLTLKNYNQTNAFQTNLQVKGQIGITPIYNYGQTSKDSVTGIQVQDRCNASYSDFTTYPLYILQTDLQNNVVYAVKSCLTGSSFKYDTSIFDISYVTSSNRDDPTVIINGNTYHTIPYSDLPSTATKNEEDNYIPGESSNFIDASSDGLNSALKNAGNWLSNTWATFTYFTSFVGQIFSSLPSELHAILISAFAITIMIGLLKHFTG